MRNVIVTGGTRGLGLSITTKLLEDGFKVIAIARSENQPFAELRNHYSEALAFVAHDLSDIDGLHSLVAAIKKKFGPPFGLVNNAAQGSHGVLGIMHNAQIEDLIRINLTSPVTLTKYVSRSMAGAGGGRIVNVSSIIATTGFSGLSVYGATKAAMIGFTKSLARELGPAGVTVNAVAPGMMTTELTASLDEIALARIASRSALRRLVEPCDAAATVAFLLGDGGRNITGAVMTIDAGATA